ncbi:MAG: sensor histidine kinase [Pseudomonadota bacterium]
MRGRRRILLLAVIIVAVAIGAVGITIVSLFNAGLTDKRTALEGRLGELAVGVAPDMHSATVVLSDDGHWHAALGELPPLLEARMPPAAPPSGVVSWLDVPDYIVAMRAVDDQAVVLAWFPLNDLRAPFQRAALHAAVGLALLLALGIALFYRMTAPLLRSIERSEARYRTLFANTAEGVLLIGNGIEECNDRFCEMFACRREDVVGLPWQEFFRRHAGDEAALAAFGQKVEAALDGGAPFTWSFSMAGNRVLVLDVALRELRDSRAVERGARRVLVSLRDVTSREEAGRVLRAAEQALRESRDKLAQAGRSSALVELAAGFAHEVNQPLAAIANYAQASRRLLESGKTEDVVRSLDRIAEQAQRAGEAIHRIRALVATAPEPAAGATCINRMVGDVVGMMADEIAACGARVSVQAGADAPVQADPLQIQQVILQLLRNALEATAGMPPAEREVLITTRCIEGCVEVSVEDRGCGVGADDRSRMFEPFYSTKENGMGMGLPISMSIIRSHHGELVVDDACGQGTRVRFRLPMDQSAARSDATCQDAPVT